MAITAIKLVTPKKPATPGGSTGYISERPGFVSQSEVFFSRRILMFMFDYKIKDTI